jgi:two-component system nitrate/nitrite response regulator NarL
MDPISLYVLDDHALFREGLLRLLEHDPSVRVVGSAGAIAAALADLARLAVDVLILDYDLGDETALTWCARSRSAGRRRAWCW